jgi:hypothetical protein
MNRFLGMRGADIRFGLHLFFVSRSFAFSLCLADHLATN